MNNHKPWELRVTERKAPIRPFMHIHKASIDEGFLLKFSIMSLRGLPT